MDSIFALWILCALVVGYFLPAIIAYRRDVPNMWSVAVINIFLGWTLIGWVVALALAARDVKQKAVA